MYVLAAACRSAAPFICRDMLSNVKRVAKKIQGSLPIVGLLSRLSAPGGGFDEIVSPSVQQRCCLRHACGFHACWRMWGVLTLRVTLLLLPLLVFVAAA